ncbi:MAG: hypothetical protein FWC09_09125 [Lachnospiraceae bacterium]|nr:hypothetical protein [Lachnospiraceae bacterium]
MRKKLQSIFILSMIIVLAFSMQAFAMPQRGMMIDIGGIIIDVSQIAEDNAVNPYELREAIEKGINADKVSPFSSLDTYSPNMIASESVEIPLIRSAPIKVTKSNQDSTAYVANSGALTASGKTPAVGMCAMHTNVTTKTGSTSSSMVKLGTVITVGNNTITIQGTAYPAFFVEDRGTPSNRTDFWIDLYFGLNNTANYNAAINYGVKQVSYYYHY